MQRDHATAVCFIRLKLTFI